MLHENLKALRKQKGGTGHPAQRGTADGLEVGVRAVCAGRGYFDEDR